MAAGPTDNVTPVKEQSAQTEATRTESPQTKASSTEARTAPTSVPLYRLFEMSLQNSKTDVSNMYSGVTLNTTFTAPSGKATRFWGFYNGGR
jgi:hypothetical protein